MRLWNEFVADFRSAAKELFAYLKGKFNELTPSGRALVILTVGLFLMLFVGVNYTRSVESYQNCIAKYLAVQNERTERLQSLAAQDRDLSQKAERNINDLVKTVATAEGKEDPAATVRDALGLFQQNAKEIASRRQSNERQRRADPLPAPPTETCN